MQQRIKLSNSLRIVLFLLAAGMIIFGTITLQPRNIPASSDTPDTLITLPRPESTSLVPSPTSPVPEQAPLAQDPPLTESNNNDPLIFTEALTLTGATEYHHLGVTGSGIRIAVIDNQFAGVSDSVARAELPDDLILKGINGQVDAADFAPGDAGHGTACAEIIHDIAPDAQLFLIQTGNLAANLKSILTYLAEQNVNIVSVSLSILSLADDESRREVYSALTTARVEYNMLVIVSAGNYARQHYHAQYLDTDHDGVHEFAPGEEPDRHELLPIWISENQGINILMQWGNSARGYRLDILDSERSLIASSQSTLPNTRTNVVLPGNVTGLIYARITAIHSLENQPADELDLLIRGGIAPIQDHQSASGSLATPADSPDVLTIGAVDPISGLLLPTSSRGSLDDDNTKPDLVSYTNVSTSIDSYGPRGFSGTSAAVPHVAGMAALLWGMPVNRNATAEQISAVLVESARDRGVAGRDNVWGAGITMLPPLQPELQIHPDDRRLVAQKVSDHYIHVVVRAQVTRADGSTLAPAHTDAWRAETSNRPATITSIRNLGSYALLDVVIPYTFWNAAVVEAEQVRLFWKDQSASLEVLPPVGVQYQQSRDDASIARLEFEIPQTLPRLGMILPVQVSVGDYGPLLQARVHAEMIDPTGHTVSIPLLDKGLSVDLHASDAVYSGVFTRFHQTGRYNIHVYATGIDTLGNNFHLAATQTIFINAEMTDNDEDGLPDVWEHTMALNRYRNDASEDPDGDQLKNRDEYQVGSHPLDWDSDQDSLSDYAEVNGYYSTTPYSEDSDSGGINDNEELLRNTNPLLASDDYTPQNIVYLPEIVSAFIPPFTNMIRWRRSDQLLWSATRDDLLAYDSTQNRFRLFNGLNGLPDAELHDVLVDSQNYIWALSAQDVYRSAMPSENLAHDMAWEPLPAIDISPRPRFQVIVESPPGTYWAGTNAGLFTYSRNTWHQVESFNQSITALSATDSGKLWLGTLSGQLYLCDSASWNSETGSLDIVEIASPAQGKRITDIAADTTGGLWISTWGAGSFVLQNETWMELQNESLNEDDFIHYVTLNDDGDIWLRGHQVVLHPRISSQGNELSWTYFSTMDSTSFTRTPDTLFAYISDSTAKRKVIANQAIDLPDALRLTFVSEIGPYLSTLIRNLPATDLPHIVSAYALISEQQPLITDLNTGINGQLWVGTSTGLLQFDPATSVWQTVRPDLRIPYLPVNTILHTNNSTWIGTHGRGIYAGSPGGWQHTMPADGLTSLYVHSLAEADDGSIWAGSASGIGGMSRFDGRRWTPANLADVPDDLYIHAIAVGTSGDLWLASDNGIDVVSQGDIRHFDAGDGLPATEVLALHIVSENEVWAGTRQGMTVWDGIQWNAPTIDNLAVSRTWDLTGFNDVLAVASTQGIWLRIEGDWQQLDLTMNGIVLDAAHPVQLAFTGDHTLWISNSGQIYELLLPR